MNLHLHSTLAFLPEQASNIAKQGDPLHWFIYGLSAFFFVLIVLIMGWFAWKYRRRTPGQEAESQKSHSTFLEIAWSLPPMVIVMVIFWIGLQDYITLANPSADPTKIQVRAYKWAWEFTHPYLEYADSELLIPKDTPIEIIMSSDDVIHSLYVPAFRVKKDAVPGRYNYTYFTATRSGEFPLYCAEYCGTQHSSMITKVIVLDSVEEWRQEIEKRANLPFRDLPDELYEQWKRITSAEQMDAFKEQARNLGPEWVRKADQLMPASVRGEELATKKGCFTCHSVDGSRLTGPTWKGIMGAMRNFTDGTSGAADENYIRESILYPNKKIVATYAAGQMPQFAGQLTERDIDAMIAYLRTLSE